MFGEREGIVTTFVAALIGTIINIIVYSLIGLGVARCTRRGDRVAAGTDSSCTKSVRSIPDYCCCHMDSDHHCGMVLPTPPVAVKKSEEECGEMKASSVYKECRLTSSSLQAKRGRKRYDPTIALNFMVMEFCLTIYLIYEIVFSNDDI